MRKYLALNLQFVLPALALLALFPLLKPATVTALNTPYENSLLSHIPNADKVMNCEFDNMAGVIPAGIDSFQRITAVSTDIQETTFTDSKCSKTLAAAGLSYDQVNQRLGISPETSGTGIGGMLMLANSELLQARPASGIIFALDQADKLLAPDAVYAADPPLPYFPGTGYALLTPIQTFWGWAATMSFSFMTLIIIAIAFAMIFRSRLGGKEVVQIQNAIPGIIMAMILIPLSYPISGLFIDAITLSTNIFHDFIFGPAGPGASVYRVGPSGDPNLARSDVEGNCPAGSNCEDAFGANGTRGLYGDDWRVSSLRIREQFGAIPLATGIAQSFCAATASSAQQATCNQVNMNQFNLIDSIISAFQNNSGLAMLIGNILNLLFNLIAIVISIKITWRLIKKFIMMIFLPITSPFIFAMVAIPGRGTKSMFDYFKQMGNCALHFIVTYCLFLIVIVFANPAYQNTVAGAASSSGYRPPVLAGWLTSIVVPQGSVSSSLIFTLLALGLFLTIPSIMDKIDETWKGAPLPFMKEALGELRSSSDVAFRQAPAVIGTAGRNLARGVGMGISAGVRARDSFRKPGTATSAEIAQQRGAANLAAAEAALIDAKASGNVGSIIAAQANLARAKAVNRISPFHAAPAGDDAQKMTVTFEALGKEITSLSLTNTLINQGSVPNINIVIKSSKYKLPNVDVQVGTGSSGAMTPGTKAPLKDGDILFVYEDKSITPPVVVAELVCKIGTKTKPGENSDKFTIPTELRILAAPRLLTAPKGSEYKPKDDKLFDIGGVRASAGLKLIRSTTT